MPNEEVLHILGVIECVIKGKGDTTGISEYVPNLLLSQTLQ